jgi:ubiquinone/menaquinone biosynthesis C-methylase UbiE
VEQEEARRGPGPAVRAIGRALNVAVARAPLLWPLIRPSMRRFFDDLAPGWDERAGAGSVAHLAPIATAVLHVKPAPERVLDLGTGTGEAALFLAREFPRASVRGVDISESMIRVAQGKIGLDPEGRVAFRVADASDLPYHPASFDLVAQLNMPPFFAETARILRPGGFAIVASSHGPSTPFHTPRRVLERGFRRRGIDELAVGDAGEGTSWVGRRRRE